MTQREEFETFWKENMNVELLPLHRTRYPFTPDCDQQYLCHETNRSWFTWQAAKAQAVPHWIPVGERLPDAGVLCIVFGANGVVNNQFEYYKQGHIKGYFGSVVDGCVFELTEVTHWVPLPSAPEQNK